MALQPVKLDLKRDRGLTIEWSDSSTSYYSIAYLRTMSPSAEQREQRSAAKRNPLHVLKSPKKQVQGPLVAESAEMVGNYAIRIRFSDGHDTGIFSWAYLAEIDPQKRGEGGGSPDAPADAQNGPGIPH